MEQIVSICKEKVTLMLPFDTVGVCVRQVPFWYSCSFFVFCF